MKSAGVFMHKATGKIWLIEKVEHYPPSVLTDVAEGFSIIVRGNAGGRQKIKRCLVLYSQFPHFERIGYL